MKVKCIDNSDSNDLLTKGKIYEVEGEPSFYQVKHDKGIVTGWLKRRFEIVEETKQSKEDKTMKIYFRDDKGQFCTAKTFFAKNDRFIAFSVNASFDKAEERYNELVEIYNKNKDTICLAIIGANEISENDCSDNNYMGISFNRYGGCSIQRKKQYTGGERKAVLSRVLKKIEEIIAVQKGYMDKANAQYIEM